MIGPPTIEPVISAPGLVNVPQYSLSWSVPANSESFVLESANGGGWTVVHNGGGNSFGASRGNGSYAYRVRACNFAGCSPTRASPVSPSCFLLQPLRSTWRVAQHAQGALSGAMQRRLARGSGATEYQLEPSGAGRRLYTGPNTYVQSSGGTYCASLYIVRACNAGGCSAWSADFPSPAAY